MPEKTSSFGALVPQISYDIIARLIPGFFISIGFLLVFYEHTEVHIIKFLEGSDYTFSFNIFLLGCFISYVVAIIIYGLNYFFLYLIYAAKGVVKKNKKHEKETLLDTSLNKDVAYLYDLIRVKYSEIGARFVKLRAEIHCALTSLTGYLILFVINSYLLYSSYNSTRLVLEIVFAACLLGLFFYKKFLETRYSMSIANHKSILNLE